MKVVHTLCHTILIAATLLVTQSATAADDGPFSVVVMDPLAKPLACDCVQGYAQRKYEKLGAYLQSHLQRKVNVYWSGSLPAAMKEHQIQPDLVIGKHSVVAADAGKADLKLTPLAELSDLDGQFTQKGLFVVRDANGAKSLADLKGYRIFFGPADCDEKNQAPMEALKAVHVDIPSTPEIASACSTAAAQLMELPADENAAAVISSYAAPLLEGCGTIQKGDLRVVGESKTVPFITAFVTEAITGEARQTLETALVDVELNAELLVALESATGFRLWKDNPQVLQRASSVEQTSDSKKKT